MKKRKRYTFCLVLSLLATTELNAFSEACVGKDGFEGEPPLSYWTGSHDLFIFKDFPATELISAIAVLGAPDPELDCTSKVLFCAQNNVVSQGQARLVKETFNVFDAVLLSLEFDVALFPDFVGKGKFTFQMTADLEDNYPHGIGRYETSVSQGNSYLKNRYGYSDAIPTGMQLCRTKAVPLFESVN